MQSRGNIPNDITVCTELVNFLARAKSLGAVKVLEIFIRDGDILMRQEIRKLFAPGDNGESHLLSDLPSYQK